MFAACKSSHFRRRKQRLPPLSNFSAASPNQTPSKNKRSNLRLPSSSTSSAQPHYHLPVVIGGPPAYPQALLPPSHPSQVLSVESASTNRQRRRRMIRDSSPPPSQQHGRSGSASPPFLMATAQFAPQRGPEAALPPVVLPSSLDGLCEDNAVEVSHITNLLNRFNHLYDAAEKPSFLEASPTPWATPSQLVHGHSPPTTKRPAGVLTCLRMYPGLTREQLRSIESPRSTKKILQHPRGTKHLEGELSQRSISDTSSIPEYRSSSRESPVDSSVASRPDGSPKPIRPANDAPGGSSSPRARRSSFQLPEMKKEGTSLTAAQKILPPVGPAALPPMPPVRATRLSHSPAVLHPHEYLDLDQRPCTKTGFTLALKRRKEKQAQKRAQRLQKQIEWEKKQRQLDDQQLSALLARRRLVVHRKGIPAMDKHVVQWRIEESMECELEVARTRKEIKVLAEKGLLTGLFALVEEEEVSRKKIISEWWRSKCEAREAWLVEMETLPKKISSF